MRRATFSGPDVRTRTVQILEKIPFGYKFALCRIPRGESVLKYGEMIGEATADIEPGAWVHVHNLASKRGRPRTIRQNDVAKGGTC